ncbi:hypothetical protein CHARACLAT_002580 [Characodon lateralis]|uniref:Uncharacterized protein n=1 Tax=Characodon lateralis TaxID=208331 RepID=A0ABU7DH86_9TELE|nr:hypothetical protein [Characodon lateralis]
MSQMKCTLSGSSRWTEGDPTVTQIHFKRLALGKLTDRCWLRLEPMQSFCWHGVRHHVSLMQQITSFCPCAEVRLTENLTLQLLSPFTSYKKGSNIRVEH